MQYDENGHGPGWKEFRPDDEMVERLCQAIALGATQGLACKYAGIPQRTFYAWKKNYPDVSARMAQAEGKGALHWLQKIEDAANNGQVQWAAWKLERRYPEIYGRQVQEQRRTQLNLTPADLEKMTDAELDGAIQRTLLGSGDEGDGEE